VNSRGMPFLSGNRKKIFFEGIGLAKDDRTFHGVFKLPDISWPGIVH